MSLWSRVAKTARRPLDGLMEGIARRRGERKQKKKEKSWKRTKQRVRAAQAHCKKQALDEVWDEHLKRVMTARISDASLPGIKEARIHWLHRAGIMTAYDVYSQGVEGMKDVHFIGPAFAQVLVEWAQGHVPDPLTLDSRSRDRFRSEYLKRLRVLKRRYLEVEGYR
jgi:DNA-binding helix-hairpin-helix protein with protein kinase domain